jgi:glutathione S-transferase
MKLFASLTSPYVRKIRILLAEKGMPCELVVDSPWEANTRIPDLNPLGKVPALIADDGEIFYDSPVIAGYLEALNAAPHLIPTNPLEAVRVRQTEALADGVLDAAVIALLESRRSDPQRSDEVIKRQMDKIERALVVMEGLLKGPSWLHGDTFGLADISVGVALGYLDLRFPEFNWRTRHPDLAQFAERLFARQSFIDTKPPVG